VGEGSDRRNKGPCETEVSDLELPVSGDENVLWLEIPGRDESRERGSERREKGPVEDSIEVAVVDPLDQLMGIGLSRDQEMIETETATMTRSGLRCPFTATIYFFKSLSTCSKTR
jgi:hypothetical protein